MSRRRASFGFVVVVAVVSCSDPVTSPVDVAIDSFGRSGPTQVTDLGTLGGTASFAWDINDRGIVVGGSELSDGTMRAFRWTAEAGMEDLGTLGGAFSNAVAINRVGVIAGTSTDAAGVTHLVAWSPHGVILDLGVAPGDPQAIVNPVDINDRNEIVGDYYAPNDANQVFHWTELTGIAFYPWHPGEAYAGGTNRFGDVAGMFCCGTAQNYGAFFSERGEGFLDIGGITHYTASAAAINDSRVVVGWDEHDPSLEPSAYRIAPFRWTPRTGFEVLGSLGGDEGFATDVNNRGEIVGTSTLSHGDFTLQAFYWTRARGMVHLGAGRPSAINNRGQIVGVSSGPSGPHATLWVGTGGISASASRSGSASLQRVGAAEACLTNTTSARSKSGLLRCLAEAR